MSVWDAIILGIVQGVVEWLPVSSEAVLVLVQQWMGSSSGIIGLVQVALFLHIGTTLSAIVYFWEDLRSVAARFYKNPWSDPLVRFYIVATVVSVAVAFGIVQLFKNAPAPSGAIGGWITIAIGFLLLFTALFQWLAGQSSSLRDMPHAIDGIIGGLGQGLAALPGVSRSGTTVAFLLLRGLDQDQALRASFIMSIPFVLIGNIALNTTGVSWGPESILAIFVAFVVGLASIHGFLHLVRRVNFAALVFVFGILVIVGGILSL